MATIVMSPAMLQKVAAVKQISPARERGQAFPLVANRRHKLLNLRHFSQFHRDVQNVAPQVGKTPITENRITT
jgi:hypothetical protein